MRRATFIVLWIIAFTIADFIAGMFFFALAGFAGVVTWRESSVVLLGMTWSFVFFCVPILALMLGLLGRLPGTRRNPTNQ